METNFATLNSMENHRRKKSSGDKFSFPIIPIQGQEFEFDFGCPTPDSPNSPADHLFSNGRLLPHSFPFQPNAAFSANYPRSTSRTSSIGSKDSLMWSRSNSTNSRSSNCSSARTSTSEASCERKLLSQGKGGSRKYQANYRPCLAPQNVYSQRWQFITPVLVLKNPKVLNPKKAQKVVHEEKRIEKQGRDKTGERSWFGRRFFRWFFVACKECHAMKTSTIDDVLEPNMESV